MAARTLSHIDLRARRLRLMPPACAQAEAQALAIRHSTEPSELAGLLAPHPLGPASIIERLVDLHTECAVWKQGGGCKWPNAPK